jgi:hypothetical protein
MTAALSAICKIMAVLGRYSTVLVKFIVLESRVKKFNIFVLYCPVLAKLFGLM